ncbi:FAD-dependent oxidoreductase [Tumebacillus sp. DT12]|uniref:FAD-dependent oxidoreductase n=1 Tax=Tumebacillus lacus TaxID=2995335 RepID=A0ABT3WWP3_9BACL|nr:FAD-dependent oxidoreductase [Tumebacillus lacus]MCX7569103.1 FAD-dependent oxidoreductase [Tumebacillus lacus]
MERYVIIGGDAAGMSAAMQIRRAHPDASVTVIEKGGTYSYAQCGLPYLVGGWIPSPDMLIARRLETFRDKYNLDARTYQEATGIDPSARTVHVRDLQAESESDVPFDKLLIATGGSAVVPKDWDGTDLGGVYALKTIPDAERIIAFAKEPDVRRVVVVGGGYIGLEMAEAFHALGKEVRVLNRGEQVAGPWDLELAGLVSAELERNGVTVTYGVEVTGLSGANGRVTSVETRSGSYPADLVLIAVGILPNSGIAKQAGITLGLQGGIEVNKRMETNLPGIYAAGDVALQYHRLKKRLDYIPLGTHANKMGRIAGKQMAGLGGVFQGVLGTAILKVFDLQVGRTGLSEGEALKEGIEVETVTIKTLDHAGYYPDAKSLTVKLVLRKSDGVLLGGQAVGPSGVDKRIDVLATALWQGMTGEELLDLDLSYAPPFNAVWDPLQQAARRFK